MIEGLSKKLISDACKDDLAVPVNETGGRSIHEDGVVSIKNLIRRMKRMLRECWFRRREKRRKTGKHENR